MLRVLFLKAYVYLSLRYIIEAFWLSPPLICGFLPGVIWMRQLNWQVEMELPGRAVGLGISITMVAFDHNGIFLFSHYSGLWHIVTRGAKWS